MNRDDRLIIPIFISGLLTIPMKPLNLLLLAFCFSLSSALFAQTPKQIEDDLVKSYKKIEYYSQKNDYDKTAAVNKEFETKLKSYTEKTPATLTYPFKALKKANVDVSTSTDGLFRIYSWDTESGGTMHFFENIMQFKTGTITKAILDKPDGEAVNNYNYNKIYSFRVNDKVYYLARYLMIGSTKDVSDGIHIFAIENGKITDAKIIKTRSGLHSDLSYDYDFGSVIDIDYDKRPGPRFDEKTNIIYLPLVDGNNQMTNKFILYKFTGQYFEKVKN